MADFIIGDEDRKRKLPQLVLLALVNTPGKTIEEIVASSKHLKTIPVGGPVQIQYQSQSLWYSKSQIDDFVQENLDIPDNVWHLGDSNRESFWYDYVAKELGKHPKTGKPVRVMESKSGKFLRRGIQRISLPDNVDLDKFTVEDAVELPKKK